MKNGKQLAINEIMFEHRYSFLLFWTHRRMPSTSIRLQRGDSTENFLTENKGKRRTVAHTARNRIVSNENGSREDGGMRGEHTAALTAEAFRKK